MSHLFTHARHTRRTADHHDFLYLLCLEAGIFKCAARGGKRSIDQWIDQLYQRGACQRALPGRAIRSHNLYRDTLRIRQCLLGGTRIAQQAALQFVVGVFDHPCFLPHPVGDGMVHVVTAQCRISGRGQHLEHATIQAQNRDIEGATAQVVNCKHALRGPVQTVGHGGGGRFIEQSQHIKAGETRSILGGLALGIVKVGRDCDDRASQYVAECRLCPVLEGFENFGRDFDRTALARYCFDTRHGGRARTEFIRQQVAETLYVLNTASHEALHRSDGIQRIVRAISSAVAYLRVGILPIVHNRRQQMSAPLVRQCVGNPAAHRGHERVGGAE
jgi:hypothetical protein